MTEDFRVPSVVGLPHITYQAALGYLHQLRQAKAREAQLRGALERIRNDEGKVCRVYETCTHVACQSSYSAWAIADEALRSSSPANENQ